jgi:beta-lactamase class A
MAAACVAVLAMGGGRVAIADSGAGETLTDSAAGETLTDSSASATLTTTVLHAVRVRRGQVARIAYRADDTAGGTVTIDLVVTTPKGVLVRTLVRGLETPVGVDLKWRGRVTLKPGRYKIVAHALDANGLSEAHASPAWLKVLQALPPKVPSAAARRAAFAWAARRAGRVAVAVVDSRGQLHGYHARAPFVSASVVKAMLLVAYLRRHATVSAAMRRVLQRMIDYSDNAAADLVYRDVGRAGLVRLAHVVRMQGFHATGAWISTRVTAADLALFFRDMETWIPKRHRRLANWLLAHVTPSQRWGIPAAAVPRGYRVYFKPGWLGAWVLANEAARLEGHGVRLGLAVFTDRNPNSAYGKETIAGVTSRLLRR